MVIGLEQKNEKIDKTQINEKIFFENYTPYLFLSLKKLLHDEVTTAINFLDSEVDDETLDYNQAGNRLTHGLVGKLKDLITSSPNAYTLIGGGIDQKQTSFEKCKNIVIRDAQEESGLELEENNLIRYYVVDEMVFYIKIFAPEVFKNLKDITYPLNKEVQYSKFYKFESDKVSKNDIFEYINYNKNERVTKLKQYKLDKYYGNIDNLGVLIRNNMDSEIEYFLTKGIKQKNYI